MPLIALKCPYCNANIQINNDSEFGFCMYCGTKILISELADRSTPKSNSKAYLKIARSIASDSIPKAYEYACKATLENPESAEAWAVRGLYSTDSSDREESFRNVRSLTADNGLSEELERILSVVDVSISWSSMAFNWGCILRIDDMSIELGKEMRTSIGVEKGTHVFTYIAPSKGLELEKRLEIDSAVSISLGIKKTLFSTSLVFESHRS